MKKETIIIIVGIIALALLYYYTSKKATPIVTNQSGLIPSATTAINKLGNAISVTSNDITSVFGALTGLLSKKDKSVSTTDVQSGFAYMGDNPILYS